MRDTHHNKDPWERLCAQLHVHVKNSPAGMLSTSHANNILNPNGDFCLLPGETERRGGREKLSLLNREQLEIVIWRPLLGIYLSRVHSLFIASGLKGIQLSQDVSADLLGVGPIKYYSQPFHPNEN